MPDWLQDLPVVWMTVAIFIGAYLIAGAIYWAVITLAVGEQARTFKALSPGMLSPLGTLFGLMVAFVAAQVWADHAAAGTAVTREASALRGVILLSSSFPGRPHAHLRMLARRHVIHAVTQEWPKMSAQEAKITVTSAPLAKALRLAVSLKPKDAGRVAAQGEIISLIGDALEARRERIIISSSAVNWVKWSGVFVLGLCNLVAIALVHGDNRTMCALALTLFATAIAVAVVLIAAHDRPFSGEISVRPTVLLQVIP